jgi:hypothetical protein
MISQKELRRIIPNCCDFIRVDKGWYFSDAGIIDEDKIRRIHNKLLAPEIYGPFISFRAMTDFVLDCYFPKK